MKAAKRLGPIVWQFNTRHSWWLLIGSKLTISHYRAGLNCGQYTLKVEW